MPGGGSHHETARLSSPTPGTAWRGGPWRGGPAAALDGGAVGRVDLLQLVHQAGQVKAVHRYLAGVAGTDPGGATAI
jgi:hypothetical protein